MQFDEWWDGLLADFKEGFSKENMEKAAQQAGRKAAESSPKQFNYEQFTRVADESAPANPMSMLNSMPSPQIGGKRNLATSLEDITDVLGGLGISMPEAPPLPPRQPSTDVPRYSQSIPQVDAKYRRKGKPSERDQRISRLPIEWQMLFRT